MNGQSSSASLNLESFLQPNSMITPGVAGGMVTLIANTAWMQFDLPAKWVALLVSACFGFLVLKGLSTSLYTRGIYFVLNTLIIFSMAMGTNTAAVQMSVSSEEEVSTESEALNFQLFPVSYADTNETQQTYSSEELDKLRQQRELIRRLEEQGILEKAPSGDAAMSATLPKRGGLSALQDQAVSQTDKKPVPNDKSTDKDTKSDATEKSSKDKKKVRRFFHQW